jgi:hypothetical protein
MEGILDDDEARCMPSWEPPTDEELDAMFAFYETRAPRPRLPLWARLGTLLLELDSLPEGRRAYVRADLLLADTLLALGWPPSEISGLGLPGSEHSTSARAETGAAAA